MIDPQVAACAAARADRTRALQEPRPNFESKIGARQSADGADIDDVSGIRILERLVSVDTDFRRVTAVEDHDLACLCDISREPYATRAENASFTIEFYQRAEVDGFYTPRFFRSRISAFMAGICHVVVLKPALPGLIAHRAVD